MVTASLCKCLGIAAAVLAFTMVPSAFAHGGGGHGHGGHGAGAGAAHGSPHGAGAGPHLSGGPAHGWHGAPGFHGGHHVNSLRGGSVGWWWVGAAAPLYVQPVAPAALLVPQESLYYCNVLQAYYPEVQTCPEPWLLVNPGPAPMPE